MIDIRNYNLYPVYNQSTRIFHLLWFIVLALQTFDMVVSSNISSIIYLSFRLVVLYTYTVYIIDDDCNMMITQVPSPINLIKSQLIKVT